MSQPTVGEETAGVIRTEEELHPATETVEAGRLRARKVVDTNHVEQVVDRGIEHADMDTVAVTGPDSGEIETRPDGSVSIPVFEEQLVIEKRLVVRERVIIRKHIVTQEEIVGADLRRERIHIEADAEIADRVTADPSVATSDTDSR